MSEDPPRQGLWAVGFNIVVGVFGGWLYFKLDDDVGPLWLPVIGVVVASLAWGAIGLVQAYRTKARKP